MDAPGNPTNSIHRFDLPINPPLTHRDQARLRYAAQYIPFLEFLADKLGRQEVIDLLGEFAFPGLKQFAEELVEEHGGNDLSVFKKLFDPSNPNLVDSLAIQVDKSTDDVLELRVTECLLAQVFREAGAADFGSAAMCCDVLLTQLVNPDIELQLDETLMKGDACCHYRWTVNR
jgi:hypothetical protein